MQAQCLCILFLLRVCTLAATTPKQPAKFTFSVQASAHNISKSQLSRILDPKVAYNIAYQWNRFGGIKNWVFENENRNVHDMKCARAEFVATLSLPGMFQEYLPTHTAYNIHLHKKLCMQGLVVTEFSRIEDVYFFTGFNVIEISRLLDGSITTDVEVYYNVPWYLIFLKANIDAYLKQSIQDRLRITYQALREG